MRLMVPFWSVDLLFCTSAYILKTEHIILHVGTNDLNSESSSERVTKYILDLENISEKRRVNIQLSPGMMSGGCNQLPNGYT